MGGKNVADLQQQPLGQRGSQDDVTIVVAGSGSATPTDSELATNAAAGAGAAPTAAAAAAVPAAGYVKPRTYYVDWLRVFLTVLVLAHHSLTTYQTSQAWKAKKGDTALWLTGMLFVYANQAYFMTLFFFLSGLYVPGSYKRKGPWHFLYDRTLRLVIPCLFYSMVIAPFLIWWGQLAASPNANPKPAIGAAFAEWFKPGWPTKYNLATGPPWFVWMLWCFNVAYVILRVGGDFVSKLVSRKGDSSVMAAPLNNSSKKDVSVAKSEYTTRQWLIGGAALITVLFVLQFAVRVLDALRFNLRPGTFVARGPFVSFMPDYFVVYVVAFGLGTYSGPAGWDVLARLPSGKAYWFLACGGVWWTVLGWVPNVVLHSVMSMQYGVGPFVGTWFLRTFVEQSFAVVWSAGLLILFREAFNARPSWFGGQVIGAAYGAYIFHYLFISLFARAFMAVLAPSAVINAACIAGPVVVSSFTVAAAVRAIPGMNRIL